MLLLYNQFDEIIYKVLKIFLIGENIMIKSIKVKDNIHRNYSRECRYILRLFITIYFSM